jgi:protoporphyrinogen oxidase
MTSVGIIGGGPAGLTLAHRLSKSGFSVTLFEAAEDLGGLARSFQFGDFRAERYYHFICADDTDYFNALKDLGIQDRLRWEPTRMGYYYSGRLYPFSSGLDLLRFDGISLAGRFRYGLLVLYCSFLNDWRGLDRKGGAQWLIDRLGYDAYMATWYPLLKVKFDDYHDQVSAAWIWHRIHRVIRSRKTPLHKEMLGYLTGGTDTLVDALVSESVRCGTTMRPGQQVARILADAGRVTGVETKDGARWNFDRVVSTVPLPLFLGMAPDLPADYRRQLSAIEYTAVVCVTLRLTQSFSKYYWLNVNDPRVPFNGCIEYTNLNRQMTPDGSTILYIPFYLPLDHERFCQSDLQLLYDCIEALRVINPAFSDDWIVDYAVSRDPFAQVICREGFAEQVPAHTTPIQGLYLIDSSQLYPSDRTISGTMGLAHRVAALIEGEHAAVDSAAELNSVPAPRSAG